MATSLITTHKATHELLDYFTELCDAGHITGLGPTNLSIGDMRDFVENEELFKLSITFALCNEKLNKTAERKLVLDITFQILDEHDFISGDMRDFYHAKFQT